MTTIAHQGVGVPMSQSRPGSPDSGRDRPVDESPDATEEFRDHPPELVEAGAGVDGMADPVDVVDLPDAEVAAVGPLDASYPEELPELDSSTADSDDPVDLDDPEADRKDGSDQVGDHTGGTPIGRVLSFRRPPAEPDRGKLIELYQSHRLRLTRMAILLVDDLTSAEDVVQDAFVELHRRWDSLVDKDSAVGYLRISVINKARSALRRRRTARNYAPPVERAHDQAAEAVVLAEEHREVLAAIKRLPPRQREILVLRYWSEMTEAEIADTLGISRGAVKSTASRALDAMEQMLEGKK